MISLEEEIKHIKAIDEYICKCPYFRGNPLEVGYLGTHVGSCDLEWTYEKICPSSRCICAKKLGLLEN